MEITLATLKMTRHAQVRLCQRGFREADVAVVLAAATRCGNDVYFLSDQDVVREITQRKREIQQFERLRGAELVVAGDALVTAYHRDGRRHLNGRTWEGE